VAAAARRQLTWQRFDTPIAIHDSCHITKKLGRPDPARQLLARIADVVEIADSPEACVCCGYYNVHANHDLNHQLHRRSWRWSPRRALREWPASA
jgi:hypothetical protein